MNWRFRCKKCGEIIEECLRIEDVYYRGKLNITHCDEVVEVLNKGVPVHRT